MVNALKPGAALSALRKMETKACEVCGKIATKRVGWKTCSGTCRKRAHTKNKSK